MLDSPALDAVTPISSPARVISAVTVCQPGMPAAQESLPQDLPVEASDEMAAEKPLSLPTGDDEYTDESEGARSEEEVEEGVEVETLEAEGCGEAKPGTAAESRPETTEDSSADGKTTAEPPAVHQGGDQVVDSNDDEETY